MEEKYIIGPKYRIAHQFCLWYLQEKRKFLFFSYWKTISTSAFLEDVEQDLSIILKPRKQ